MTDPLIRDALRDFVAEREWEQFHTAENLTKSISIEAAELHVAMGTDHVDLRNA